MTPESIALQNAARFADLFAAAPTLAAFSPGRVNFIGEHTDYTNGLCMPFAIDRFVVVLGALADRSGTARIRLRSLTNSDVIEIPLEDGAQRPSDDWSTYARGVLFGLHERGVTVPSLDVLVVGNLPVGAGLSSSAALEVALIRLFLKAAEQTLTDDEIMLIAQQAEHDFAGVPCGLLDQFSVVAGRESQLLLFDSRERSGTAVPIARHELTFLVIDSQVNHSLSDGAYAERRSQCEQLEDLLQKSLRDAGLAELERATDDPILLKRGRHIISENQRVLDMRLALANGDWTRVGALLFEGHASLRDDFEVSCAETDLLVALASDFQQQGLVGARMTGGGFGGSVIALVPESSADALGTEIARRYKAATGLMTTPLKVTPANGAGIIDQGAWQ